MQCMLHAQCSTDMTMHVKLQYEIMCMHVLMPVIGSRVGKGLVNCCMHPPSKGIN